MDDAQLTRQLGILTIDVSVLRLAVAEIIAEKCRNSDNPTDALRAFSERLHSRVDRAALPPAQIQGMIEGARQRIDELIRAVQVSLDG
jgi:hypothetical protein